MLKCQQLSRLIYPCSCHFKKVNLKYMYMRCQQIHTRENMIGNSNCDVAVLLVTSVARATMQLIRNTINVLSNLLSATSSPPTYFESPDSWNQRGNDGKYVSIGTESVRTQVDSYSSQFVLILVNSYQNDYELNKMSRI